MGSEMCIRDRTITCEQILRRPASIRRRKSGLGVQREGTIPDYLQGRIVQPQRLGVVLTQPAPAFRKAGLNKETILSGEHPELQKLKQLGSQPYTIHAADPVPGVLEQKLVTRPDPPHPWCQNLHHGTRLVVTFLRLRMGVVNPGLYLTIKV